MSLGLAALQLACAGWATGSAYSKRHRHGEDVLGATALQMLFGGVLMAIVASVLGEWQSLAFTPRTVAAIVYLTVAGSVAAFVAYVYALRHLPISTVSLHAWRRRCTVGPGLPSPIGRRSTFVTGRTHGLVLVKNASSAV